MLNKTIKSIMLVFILGLGVSVASMPNSSEVSAKEQVVGSYKLPAADAKNMYETINGDNAAGKTLDILTAFLPNGAALIANNGISTQDRKEIEKAYHNNVGLIVIVKSGTMSYEGGADFIADL